jgi:hypothetical protein
VGALERVVLCRISCCILYFSWSSKLWGTLLFQATCYMCRHSFFLLILVKGEGEHSPDIVLVGCQFLFRGWMDKKWMVVSVIVGLQ